MENSSNVVKLEPQKETTTEIREVVLSELQDLAINAMGGSGSGGSLEPRVAKLEADVEHIKNSVSQIADNVREIRNCQQQDFRFILKAGAAAVVAVLGVMAKGFNWF